MEIYTEHIFCPKCGHTGLECDHCDIPEWVSNDEVRSEETYVCGRCGHEFTVCTIYVLSTFSFCGKDDDDKDYRITGLPDKG